MTERTITIPLRRWHKLLKAMGEVRPGLTGDDAKLCDNVQKFIGEAVFNQFGTEPFAVVRPRESWLKLCYFCRHHGIHYGDISEQIFTEV